MKSPTHILLIEDQINLAKFIRLELEEQGYQVSIAGNIQFGLQILQKSQPHLIILDWRLIDRSSREYKRLQEQKNEIPILITTVQENNQANLNVKHHYLLMPFTIQELWTKIESCLSSTIAAKLDAEASRLNSIGELCYNQGRSSTLV